MCRFSTHCPGISCAKARFNWWVSASHSLQYGKRCPLVLCLAWNKRKVRRQPRLFFLVDFELFFYFTSSKMLQLAYRVFVSWLSKLVHKRFLVCQHEGVGTFQILAEMRNAAVHSQQLAFQAENLDLRFKLIEDAGVRAQEPPLSGRGVRGFPNDSWRAGSVHEELKWWWSGSRLKRSWRVISSSATRWEASA